MRIILIGAESTGLGAQLAAQLHLDHIHGPEQLAADGFVLEGWPRDLRDAQALDSALRSRAADVDAVVWLGGGSEAVIDHYRGRVVEVPPGDDLLGSALDGLREVLLAA
ncbi:MAG: hypothetical protein ABI566_07910 [Pseudolysinimonas sp.]